jgi:hypothetical protein
LGRTAAALGEKTFESLIDYTAKRSKRGRRKMNLSDDVKELPTEALRPNGREAS